MPSCVSRSKSRFDPQEFLNRMTSLLKRRGFVWALLLLVCLMNGLMIAPSVAHTLHHATHHAGTHATGLCAWLCAAGQSVESTPVRIDGDFRPVTFVEHPVVRAVLLQTGLQIFFRGPPSLHL